MTSPLLRHASASCVIIVIILASHTTAQDDADGRQVKPPVVEYRGAGFEGTVKYLDTTTLDIDGIAYLHRPPFTKEGVWTFRPSADLDIDPERRGEADYNCYRWQDMKRGDQVVITFDRVDGENICKAIRIMKRPGGLVPPSPYTAFPSRIPYHEWCNAYNDWVDRGIPVPERIRGSGGQRSPKTPATPPARP